MELQQVAKEVESNQGGEGASEKILEAKAEEEADIYSKLDSPSEDIYVEAGHPILKQRSDKQTEGNVRVYRGVCVFLSIICLVLLLVVIILCEKLTSGNSAMPAEMCSFEKCQARFSNSHFQDLGCQRCAEGWVAFENSCFYLSRHKLSWEDSHRNCTARGGDLAVISNKNVQNFLSTKGNVMYWIGLKYRGNQWTWVNNTVLVESYWGTGTAGLCGVLSGGKPPENNWVQGSCSSKTYYICQLQQ